MNDAEAKQKIAALLDAAEDDNLWGGDETEDGCLTLGKVDWKKLKKDIDAVLNEMEESPQTEDQP